MLARVNRASTAAGCNPSVSAGKIRFCGRSSPIKGSNPNFTPKKRISSNPAQNDGNE